MSLAASKLYISQPTVSQAIAELEKKYGAKLFERYPKELYITDVGKILLSYAENVLVSYDNLNDAMFKLVNSHSLNIGATVTVGTCLIDNIVQKMIEQYPEINTYVYVNNTENIEEKLLCNDLDIGLVEGIIKNNDITSTPVIDDYLVLVCSNKHPYVNETSITLDDLSTQSFILREQGSGTRELFVKFMESKGYKLNIKWECNNSEAIKKAVMGNRGLTVISLRLVADEIRKGKIHIVKVKNCIWKRSFSLAYHKNKFISSDMSLFIDLVKDYSGINIIDVIPPELI